VIQAPRGDSGVSHHLPVLLRLPDPDGRYTAVRLRSDLPTREFARDDGEWRLELEELPPVERLEYQLEVEHDDGGTEYLLDPGNPHTAPGAFGKKSVLLLPTYRPPVWLDEPQAEGHVISLTTRGRGVGASVDVDLWSPADADPREALPLLVTHDGPEYDRLAGLTRFAAVKIAAGDLPRHRVALLAPGERDEWYSASPRYLRALTHRVLPAIARAAPTDGPPAAMGASLGALALLHAQRRHPGTFRALFLQSGSFFTPRFDAHESGMPHYHRIVGFVSETHRAGYRSPVPTTLTCGAAEENIHNNRLMAETLQAPLHELTDTHNYTAWRDAFDPYLTRLLAEAW
jgi:enterochelin esterase-like enzyme